MGGPWNSIWACLSCHALLFLSLVKCMSFFPDEKTSCLFILSFSLPSFLSLPFFCICVCVKESALLSIVRERGEREGERVSLCVCLCAFLRTGHRAQYMKSIDCWAISIPPSSSPSSFCILFSIRHLGEIWTHCFLRQAALPSQSLFFSAFWIAEDTGLS